MDERFATQEDFLSRADSALKPYLEIAPINVPYNKDFLMAFQMATRLIGKAIDRPIFLYVVVGSPPFELQVRHHKLIFDQHESVAATHLNGVIFLNFDNLSQSTLRLMTAGILEEFAHGMLNIRDELLVRNVVSFLLPGVGVTEIGYIERDDQ